MMFFAARELSKLWRKISTETGIEVKLLLENWKLLLAGLIFQYIHGLAARGVHYLHRPGPILQDIGFIILPELGKDRGYISESLFSFLFLSFVLWTFNPFIFQSKRFYTVLLWCRVLGTLVACQLLRIITFYSTQLPGPNYHCREGSSLARLPRPDNLLEVLLLNFPRGVIYGCGDLIFSSHTIFTLIFVLTYQKFGSKRWIKRLAWFLAVIQSLLIIASRKHYTVDVVVAWYTVNLVVFFIDKKIPEMDNRSTSSSPLLPVSSNVRESRDGRSKDENISLLNGNNIHPVDRIGNKTVRRLGKERTVVVVDGRLPGPSIVAREGDTLIIHVINQSPYNMTVHWHGIFQKLSEWSDGPAYVTQCPIRPGYNFTYRYKVVEQEGTLWYHAHISFLRATVYGALIIYPRLGRSYGYPFPKPHREIPILLGEWWDANLVEVEAVALASGGRPVHADAFTINGKPGNLYPFSTQDVYRTRKVVRGKRYLLRIINAALNAQFFFKIAGHNMTVVAADASYTNPHTTDTVVIAPGQTIDALLIADATPSTYYIVASQYFSAAGIPVPNTPPTIGLLRYRRTNAATYNVSNFRIVPPMPKRTDTGAAHLFYNALTSLTNKPQVPVDVDVRMLVTLGFGLMPCGDGQSCGPPFEGWQVVGSMNNVSLRLPAQISLLEAHYRGIDGVFTADFPDRPAMDFDYVGVGSVKEGLCRTTKGTRLKRLKYGARVEVVLQNTAIVGIENHPIHLHGYNFFVAAQGFGNYNEGGASLNLVNPHVRNTIAVPAGGWAVLRFVADNPGVWIMHCHLDLHLPLGLAAVFVVEDGPTISSTLPPPPPNFPRC